MTAPNATGIRRYGLSVNPYALRPLDELSRPSDGEQLTEVAALADVRAYIDRAVELREPAIVLITGGKGTGRTTVANHLLAYYRSRRAVAPGRFVVPDVKLTTRDDYGIFRNWVASLALNLEMEGVPLPGVYARLHDGAELDPVTYQTTLALLMSGLPEILSGHEVAFGVRLENVETYAVVEAALSVFGASETIVVLTMLDYSETRESVLTPFRQHQPTGSAADGLHYPVLSLTAMDGEAASTLIERRWRSASALEPPFERPTLVSAFSDRRRAAGKILRFTYRALNHKLAQEGTGGLWPEATELAFGDAELHAFVKLMDTHSQEVADG
jgi:hypothetical protein